MKNYDTIIIGAGPAGLFCAINAAENSKRKILLLEKNSSPGRKFLLSGSGQCNITHRGSIADFTRCYGEGGNFVKPALSAFPSEAMVSFLEKNKIPVTEREDGKIFPQSMNASDVLSMMLNLCREKKVEIKYESPATEAVYHSGEFRVSSGKNMETFTTPVLVISTGGQSYPSTGSSGDGYRLAEKLGHSIITPTPALSPVFIRDFPFAELSGISLKNRNISLFRNNKKKLSAAGDLLFTHKGLSGPGILDMSRYILSGDILKISITGAEPEELKKDIINLSGSEGKKSVKNFLKNYDIPERVISAILEEIKISQHKKISEITKAERSLLITSLTELPFNVKEKGGINIAMATAGGICRDEINRRSMESKIVSTLYFAGEIIDIDGDTGGYNIHWAFASGRAAAQSLLEKG